MKFLSCLLSSVIVISTGHAANRKEELSIASFDPPLEIKRALERKGIQTIGEAALINDEKEARKLLGRLPEPDSDWLTNELRELGLSFGSSPFAKLSFRDRLLLHRSGAKSKYDLVKYGNFLEDQIDSGSMEERLNLLSPKLREMITSLRSQDPSIEANAKLKTLSGELEDLLQLIYSQENGLQALSLDTELIHKTTAHLEKVRQLLRRYQQQVECHKAMQSGP